MIDLHLHTTASDGRLPPFELVRLAAHAGLSIISVTDHDTTAGLDEARYVAERAGIRLINGIEITAVEGGHDVHVLGYFIDHESPALAEFLRRQRADRIRRVRAMAQRLAALGLRVDVEPRLAASEPSGGRSVGRPLLADVLVEAGHAIDRRDAFDRLLARGRPAFVPRRGACVAQVIAVVHRAFGIASLAHPGLLGLDEEIPRFCAAGLSAIEARHSDHDAVAEDRYRGMASELRVAVSGGSDFHGDPTHHAATLGVVTLPPRDFELFEACARRRSDGRVGV